MYVCYIIIKKYTKFKTRKIIKYLKYLQDVNNFCLCYQISSLEDPEISNSHKREREKTTISDFGL